jgi:pimeloyl-ACP methyl ester carboxylesterase
MGRFAEDIHALLQRLRASPAILVGHSMGGYVALAFAKAFPESLRALVLVSTKAGADTPGAAAARQASAERVQTEGPAVVVDAMAPKMLSESNADAAMATAVKGFMVGSSPEGVAAALLGMAGRPDAGTWLKEILVPTLVIAGLDDTLIPPSESEAMAKAIHGAQLRLIPRAGHLVAFEQAEAFNAALMDWPERIGNFEPLLESGAR